jgi:hypothetical protein
MKRNIFILVANMLSTSILLTQQPSLPYLRDVSLTAKIVFDATREIYSYTYTIQNASTNPGKIISFEIDISRNPNSIILSDSGLQFKNTRIEDAYKRLAVRLGGQIIPVSFPSSPMYCDPGLTVRRTVDFFRPLIPQGQQVGGFVLSSRGLPTIRKFVAIPQFEVNDYYPPADEVSNPDSLAEKVDADREAINFHGFTIGPAAPPLDLSASSWLDTLVSYKHESVALGWIDNQGIANSLDSKLDSAKSKLAVGDTTAAKNVLNAFVNEVEAQNGNHLSSEAFALLKFNAEYLIQRLE